LLKTLFRITARDAEDALTIIHEFGGNLLEAAGHGDPRYFAANERNA
jgi:hypothetical protein